MVPQPVWQERPEPAWKTADPTVTSGAVETESGVPTDSKNVSGRWWKQPHKATVRSQTGKKDGAKLDKTWKIREEQRKKDDAVKKLEREMKEEKLAEAERKRAATKERKEREAEKKRLEEMAARMSAKKLQRMKKRMGRSKKVNQ
ncbi:hypothetical protein JCM3766R1_002271 [Sporobolomyces carnicolor]